MRVYTLQTCIHASTLAYYMYNIMYSYNYIHSCTFFLQRWCDGFHASVKTNNGVESLNKLFKFCYNSLRTDKTVSGLCQLIRDNFLPDNLQRYVHHNLKSFSEIKLYDPSIPLYLQNQSHWFSSTACNDYMLPSLLRWLLKSKIMPPFWSGQALLVLPVVSTAFNWMITSTWAVTVHTFRSTSSRASTSLLCSHLLQAIHGSHYLPIPQEPPYQHLSWGILSGTEIRTRPQCNRHSWSEEEWRTLRNGIGWDPSRGRGHGC